MKNVKSKWLSMVIIPIVLGMVMFFCSSVFYLNDDVTMRSILSGAYTGTPDGHAVYMQYPLTGILAILYRVVGCVPWMECFFVGCILLCMLLVAKRFSYQPVGCLVTLGLYIPFVVYMHYTLIAALVAATALFLVVTDEDIRWPIGLLWIAYMIRSQIGLLGLPFLICGMLWRIIERKAENPQKWMKRYSLMMVGVLVGFVAVYLVNGLCYSGKEWKEYSAFNSARTQLYDYTDFLSTKYYGENPADYGMTQQEYDILYSYNLMLDHELDEEKMAQVAEAVSAGLHQNVSFFERAKNCIKEYYFHIRYQDVPLKYIWIFLYVVILAGLLKCKNWIQLVNLIVLGAGRSFIWLYLIWQGRFPERVYLSLYLIEIMLLLGMLLRLEMQVANKKKLKLAINILVVVIFAVIGMEQWQDASQKVLQRKEIQKGWEALKEHCTEQTENIYLVDVFSVVQYAEDLYVQDIENVKLLGGWTSASPLSEEIFTELDVSDGAEALYNCDNVRLVVAKERDISWLEKLMQDRFGNVQLVETAEINWNDSVGFVEYMIK